MSRGELTAESVLRDGETLTNLIEIWGDHLWSPSYFVVSCGGAPIEIVRPYIEDQRR